MWRDRDPYRDHQYVPDTFWLLVAALLFAACGLVWLIGQVAAIIPDREHFTSELKAESGAPFPILTDFDNGYALSLNLAFWVGDEMQRLMTLSGWDVTLSQGSDTWLLPVPATFVVGTDGKVTARFMDPDYRKRMAIEDLLSALRAAH